MPTYKVDFHEFRKPYIDSNGVSWWCYCKAYIDYRMVRDSIDYPNGLVRHIIEPVIDSYEIFDLEVFKDSEGVLEGDEIPDEMVKFFSDSFDPEKYEENLE